MELDRFRGRGVAPDRALAWFVRIAIDVLYEDRPVRGRYKHGYREAEAVLKAEGTTVRIEPNRHRQIVSKPVTTLYPSERESLLAIARVLVRDMPPGAVDEMIEMACLRARGGRGKGSGAPHFDVGADFLGAQMSELFGALLRAPDEDLAHLFGDYLVLRWSETTPGLVVSLMTIDHAADEHFLPTFRTRGVAYGGQIERIDGVVFRTEGAPGSLYTLGHDYRRRQLRACILAKVLKPLPGAVGLDLPQDLKGVRLGFGRVSTNPRADRVWCSRLTDGLGPDFWLEFAREYQADDPLTVFEARVAGLDFILEWLRSRPSCRVEHRTDPSPP